MEDPENPFECRIGPAVMSMHTWAADAEESADMLLAIGREIGFCTTGPSRVYDTPPTKPPPSDDTPYGYDIQFVSFDGPDVA
ncbi:MAG: hypothetical protein JSR82_06495 [Verrucomicrobia bacterium]|nr:hypothetical protein [Verrucomicrobiota bacterium]